jgi:hypothetical protein
MDLRNGLGLRHERDDYGYFYGFAIQVVGGFFIHLHEARSLSVGFVQDPRALLKLE